MSTTIAGGIKTKCYHCGEVCNTNRIRAGEKTFCCEGCKLVYQILSQQGLCEYYNLNESPGNTQKINTRTEKFAFLDNESIVSSLICFRDNVHIHVHFYLPQIHCSSCLYLLENLHKINEGIISSKVNFSRKEVAVVYNSKVTNLRKLAELLTSIGYEPYISLNDLKEKKPVADRSMIYRLGVAGFCFGNIMLMSFPEYLGLDASEASLLNIFRWMDFILALPVVLYAAYPFYESSVKSLRHRFLNIDAPIALAIIITFIRSASEVIAGTGSGYFDSMSGIVFFMLAGRILQNKTYRQLSFDRDYTSYFPIAVSVIKDGLEKPVTLPDIKTGDTLLIHNEELIPADGILTRGKAYIDYSFVTGESAPVLKEMGELLYAGGKQTGSNIEVLVVKEAAQSYLTALWSRDELKSREEKAVSFVHLLSRYFTWIVFAIAFITAVYWQMHAPARMWPAVTSVFIIACPCALLLSNTFTNGNILRILSANQFYLRHAQIIENIGNINHIVFDKTGTLTSAGEQQIVYNGVPLSKFEKQQLASLASCSGHPLSKAIAKELGNLISLPVTDFREIPGYGLSGMVQGNKIKMGSSSFITRKAGESYGTAVFISFDAKIYGSFRFSNKYRDDIPLLIKKLKRHFKVSVLTGDNEMEKSRLKKLFGEDSLMLFNQKPEDKLQCIKTLQQNGYKVMMVGDGLNDAGALKQSDVGIAVSDNNNNFTPSSDAIMSVAQLSKLSTFISFCKANRIIVLSSFILSVAYNLAGLYFAVRGNLSPLVAAILMPCSSLSIFLVTFGTSNWLARRMQLLQRKYS